MKSIKALVAVGLITHVHEDDRRAIGEFNAEEEDFSIQRFLVKERIPLGNHYHKNKDEIFVILKGSGKVTVRHAEDGLFNFGVETLLEEGSVVRIEAMTAHTFVLEPGSEMICFSTKAFDKDDMYPYMLVSPESVK